MSISSPGTSRRECHLVHRVLVGIWLRLAVCFRQAMNHDGDTIARAIQLVKPLCNYRQHNDTQKLLQGVTALALVLHCMQGKCLCDLCWECWNIPDPPTSMTLYQVTLKDARNLCHLNLLSSPQTFLDGLYAFTEQSLSGWGAVQGCDAVGTALRDPKELGCI